MNGASAMKLSTEQLARMSRLLDEAIDLDEVGRAAWLRALPPEHRDLEPALRQGLLAVKDHASGGDASVNLPKIDAGTGARAESDLQAGDLVGPYRLMRQLGAGGMAEVWQAQRADGAFKREVALKIPVGLERRDDLARRFVVERDILAALEHPRIARFYDAGVSQDGRPYIALEYVAGENLLQWADARRLGIRERIELHLQVLEAVQYAHARGVLHRDIKPSNVLVTDAGQASLLDFGVAKLIKPTEPDLTTVYGQALTPGYASPEQVKGENIDVASDVYSLGVVLYELLSGRRPYEVAGRTIESDRAVARPSARVDAEAAAARGSGIARIARILKGDLDAIVLKAVAQSPADRYRSVAALSQDLSRFLAGEAVQAVSPSGSYKASKFLGRNRVGAALAAAIAVAVIGTSYQWLYRSQSANELAKEAATALPTVSAMANAGQPNAEAFNLVLQGEVYSNGPFQRDAERAEVLFKKATALDPEYALPWVKLGLLYVREARLSWMPKNEGIAQARRAIETALQIDPNLMAAHAARFRYLVQVDHQWAEARAVLDRMRAIDMNDPLLLPECEAYFAAITGNLDEAIKIQRQIVRRNPLNSAPMGVLALFLFERDQFEESLALFRQVLQMNPHAVSDHGLIGVALALLGRGQEALVEIAEERHEGYRLWALSIAQWTLERQDESDAALNALTGNFPETSAYYIAQLHALRGKRDLAFEWLSRACSEPLSGCEFLKADRFFRGLHDDPRYKALLVKMKLHGDRFARHSRQSKRSVGSLTEARDASVSPEG